MFKLYQHEFASQETESTHIYLSRLSNKTLKQFLVITARRNQITHSIRQYFLNYVSFNIKSGKGKKNDFRQISTDLLLLRIFSNRQKISFLLQIVLEILILEFLFSEIIQNHLSRLSHNNSKPRIFLVIEFGMKGKISHWFYFSSVSAKTRLYQYLGNKLM